MFQIVRGALATPRAVCMASQGWHWDRAVGDWAQPVPYSLAEEATRVLGSAGAGAEEERSDCEGNASPSTSRRAVDTFYYDQLGLQPSASQSDIRKAYFQQSKRWHPDKSSEPNATERFQGISDAYQVLSDPERRRVYDAHGQQGIGEGFIDARTFFSVLLGADALEPYIGRVRLAEMFGDALFGGEDDDANQPADASRQKREAEKSKRRQVRRQVRLAVSLVERLDARTASSAAAFRQVALEEGKQLLKKDATVVRFLADIGWVYHNRAEAHLARCDSKFGSLGVRALCLRMRRGGREASQQAQTAKLALRSYLKLRKIVSEADTMTNAGGEEAAEMPGSISSALPTFMETFLSLTSHDITGTLDKVIERVLGDEAAGQEVCRQRAEGLRLLGDAFMEAGNGADTAAEAVAGSSPEGAVAGDEDERRRKRFEEAFAASLGAGSSGGPVRTGVD